MRFPPRSRGHVRLARPGARFAGLLLAVALTWANVMPPLNPVAVAAAAEANVVSVRDFGAAGNGVTDDTVAIQAAVKSGSTPRTVVFPPGTYPFANVWVGSDTALVFQDGAIALAPPQATEADVFFGVVGTDNVRVCNVSLEGGTFEGRGVMGGVFVAKYADHVAVRRTSSVNVLKNVSTQLSANIEVRDCVASGGRWGFAFEQSAHIVVAGCESRNTARDGIVFYSRCQYVTASDNLVVDYMTGGNVGVGGIQVYGSSDATITGNVILNGHYDSAGIRFRDSDVFWCEGNYIENPGSSGLQVHRVGDFPGLDGGNGTFINNVVTGAKLRGVDVANPLSKKVRILGNTILDTSSASDVSAGMAIVALPADCAVVGNHIERATGAGIQVGGSGQLVAWNSVKDVASVNFGPRVGVFVTGTGQAVVANTIVDSLGNMLNGIRTYDGSSALLRDNVIDGSTGAPYDIRGTELPVVRNDAQPPAISRSLEPASSSEWALSIIATDASSEVAALRVTVDGNAPQILAGAEGSVMLSAAQAHDVEIAAVDQAGNVAVETFETPPMSTDPGTVSLEHDAAGIVFDRWVTGYSTAYSGGGYVYGRWAGTVLKASFKGSSIEWIGPKQPSYGMADVWIDGALVASNVDCYAPAPGTLSTTIWESAALADGPHTIELKLVGHKNAASTGNVVVLDKLEVTGASPSGGGTRYDDSTASPGYTGSWLPCVNPTYVNTTYAYSRWTNAAFTLPFTGTRVSWIGPRTTNYGIADVYIDSVKVATVDCYRANLATQGWREVVWTSGVLSAGAHTLVIRPTGTKHPSATAANVVVDAIDVAP